MSTALPESNQMFEIILEFFLQGRPRGHGYNMTDDKRWKKNILEKVQTWAMTWNWKGKSECINRIYCKTAIIVITGALPISSHSFSLLLSDTLQFGGVIVGGFRAATSKVSLLVVLTVTLWLFVPSQPQKCVITLSRAVGNNGFDAATVAISIREVLPPWKHLSDLISLQR